MRYIFAFQESLGTRLGMRYVKVSVEKRGLYLIVLQACAVAEATLKHSKEVLSTEKRNHKALVKAWEEVSSCISYVRKRFLCYMC